MYLKDTLLRSAYAKATADTVKKAALVGGL